MKRPRNLARVCFRPPVTRHGCTKRSLSVSEPAAPLSRCPSQMPLPCTCPRCRIFRSADGITCYRKGCPRSRNSTSTDLYKCLIFAKTCIVRQSRRTKHSLRDKFVVNAHIQLRQTAQRQRRSRKAIRRSACPGENYGKPVVFRSSDMLTHKHGNSERRHCCGNQRTRFDRPGGPWPHVLWRNRCPHTLSDRIANSRHRSGQLEHW